MCTSLEKLNDQDLKNKVESAIRHFIGSLGLASAGPIFVKIIDKSKNSSLSSRNTLKSTVKKTGNTYRYKSLITLSVLTKYVDYVKASLTLFKDKDVSMKCVGVSGTIKKSERFLK